MIPDPLKDWFADESKQSQLIEALNAPIFKEATALLNTISLPSPDFTDRPSAEAITHAANEHWRNAGFFSYLSHLWQLTEAPKAPPQKPDAYSNSYVTGWARARGYLIEQPEEPNQQ